MDDHFIDIDLKEQIIAHIPEDKRDEVLCSLVYLFVDFAPVDFMLKLTGEAEAFEEAELILKEFYRAETFDSLIEDAMKMLGLRKLCNHLDSLNLVPNE